MIEHAILLSAGQGSRLLPLTADRPKCLIDLSGRPLIAWQIAMLAAAGVRRIDVVTGFKTDMVERALLGNAHPGTRVECHFNPFFQVADNLGSCWIVRDRMVDDFVILNGDTLVGEDLVRRVLEPGDWPITVTVDEKDAYDNDDMKVSREGERLRAVGKTLDAAETDAESIGFIAFRAAGPALFRECVRQMMRTPDGVNHWYLKAIDRLAREGHVGTRSIRGMDWAEVDYLNDIEDARVLTDRWAGE